MNPKLTGIIIGGIIPALLLGVLALFQKMSTQKGIGIALLMICAGLGVVAAGVIFYIIMPDKTISLKSALPAGGVGICWAIGFGLISIGIVKYDIPISKLVPLYNMNTLVAVILCLFVLAEHRDVNVPKLLIASVLIIIGGTLAANS